MRHLLTTVAALLILSSTACAGGPPRWAGSANGVETGREGGATRALEVLDRAVATGDVPRALGCFTKDARLVDGLTGEAVGAAEVASLWSKAYARAADRTPGAAATIAPRRVSLAPSGDIAWFEDALDQPVNAHGEVRCSSGLIVRAAAGWLVSHCELGGVAPSPSIADAELGGPPEPVGGARSLVSSPSPASPQ